jgi:hypothetical protein
MLYKGLPYIFFCYIVAIFLGCKTDKKDTTKILDSSEFDIPLKEKDLNAIKKFTDFFCAPQILSLKTPDSIFISSVSKIIFYKNRFFLLDKKFSNLTCFDKNGNFLMQYGRIGLGAKEFKAITDFDIDSVKNQVVIFSNEDESLYYYLLDNGAFIKKKYIGFYGGAFALLPFDQIMLYARYTINKKILGYNIIVIDSNKNIVNKFLPFNSKFSPFGWSFTGFLNKSNNQIYFTDAFNDSVFSYQNKQFSVVTHIDINSDSIQTNRLDHKKLFTSKIILDSSTSYLRNNFFKNDSYVIFNYQFEKRTKVAIYQIKDEKLFVITTKNADDPLLFLTENPLYLNTDNTVVFAISPDDILNLKQKNLKMFEKLPNEIKNSFYQTRLTSNFYLLISKLKE